jgi:uncharacterized membrane protein YfcA
MKLLPEQWGNAAFAWLTLLIGVSLAVWGYRVFRSPSRLKPGSFVCHWLQRAMRGRSRRTSLDPSQELTHHQIRFWASMAILAGVLTALAGVAGLLEIAVHFP